MLGAFVHVGAFDSWESDSSGHYGFGSHMNEVTVLALQKLAFAKETARCLTFLVCSL